MSEFTIKTFKNTCPPEFIPMIGEGSFQGNSRQIGVGVCVDGVPAGAAVFTYGAEGITLDHIYVLPEQRHKGAGHAMLSYMASSVRENGRKTVPVSAIFSSPDVDEETLSFLQEEGFETFRQSDLYAFPIKALFPPAPFESKVKPQAELSIVSFDKLSRADAARLQEELDLPDGDEDLSFVEYDAGGAPEGILIARDLDGTGTFLLHFENHRKKSLRAFYLLRALYDRLRTRGVDGEYEISFLAIDPRLPRLIETLVSDPSLVRKIGSSYLAVKLLR